MTPAERANLEYVYDRLYGLYESGDIRPGEMQQLQDLDAVLRPLQEAESAQYEAETQPMLMARDPSIVERVQDFLAPAMSSLPGMDARGGQRLAGKAAGLLDITPFVGGGMSAGQAVQDARAGDYGSAAANLGFAAMDIVPGVAALRAGRGPIKSGLMDFLADESGALRLYHGSPHDFDRFSTQNMYGGQGKQAYGRGLYFAENENVAKAFRALNPSTAKIKHDGKTIRGDNQSLAAWYIGKNNGDKDAAIRDYTNVWKPKSAKDPVLLAFEKLDPSKLRLGNMYEVDVSANPADFMDWDAAMSAQPMAVQNALSPMVTSRLDMLEEAGQRAREAAVAKGLPDFTPKSRDRLYQEMRGGDIIGASRMGQLPGEVENMLSGAGVPGIRYLDDGTVGGGKGSRNYVVFDENLINIVRKYGVAGAAAMLGMSQADVSQAMQQQQQPQGLLSMGAQ
jgi:hypothetical protein